MSLIWIEMNGILGKAKFDSLRILLDSGDISYIILFKHTQKTRNKMTKPFRWNTQGGV